MHIDKKEPTTIILAMAFTAIAVILGYSALGIWPAFIFTFGYLGGLIIWLFTPMRATFKQIGIPYFLTLALFIVHKIEERERDFFLP
ncbi:MAG: hypothetical protein MUC81_13215 [Bacteroidia bacterium]|jgi:hypothetical protein|nr:hypothetical protein [Bacteroidia bacterium]